MSTHFQNTFKGKTVLITGHTGFKGTWLSIWLKRLGAHVVGYSLDPPTQPNLFELTGIKKEITHYEGDILDLNYLKQVIQKTSPHVLFHLAAQSIVRHGFERPHETFLVNSGGTVNVLEAVRENDSLQAVVIVTTDKCYENREWIWGYRETDFLGGKDPYSASKAMAEIATKAYRESFLKEKIPVATVRAGNVIGGGDFSSYRLIPDCMRALIHKTPVEVRNPNSLRPWLHVLDPLYGYLMIASQMLKEGELWAEEWNFGPLEYVAIPVKDIVEKAIMFWGEGDWIDHSTSSDSKEMAFLKLNWDKAAHRLRWKPRYTWEEALERTVEWFKAYASFITSEKKSLNLLETCIQQIDNY